MDLIFVFDNIEVLCKFRNIKNTTGTYILGLRKLDKGFHLSVTSGHFRLMTLSWAEPGWVVVANDKKKVLTLS